MGCYVCAYGLPGQPSEAHPLPAGSSVDVHDPIGTCGTCSVWACSAHGSRYGTFECAICTPAAAVAQALTGSSGAASTLALAAAIQPTVSRAGLAVDRLVADMRQVKEPAVASTRTRGEPNLITNLAGALAAVMPARGDFAPAARKQTTLSVDAIGAVVAGRLGNKSPAPAPRAAEIVAGAVTLAHQLADPHRADGAPRDPWQVTYPALLDPLLWAVGLAMNS